jgi:oligoendopeptidase F
MLRGHWDGNTTTMLKLPTSIIEFQNWNWDQIEPFYQELINRTLDDQNVYEWLADWTQLASLLSERFQRTFLATAVDTRDESAAQRYAAFLDEIYPREQSMEQRLKEKLLASRLEPEGFAIPLRNLRAEADLYCEANLELLSEELKLGTEYDRIIGAQTVSWQGEEITISQMRPHLQDTNRVKREQAWRLASTRQLADRQSINTLWQKFLDLRLQIASNAGKPDYRAYKWQEMHRFDYSPDDCFQFHQAIETAVVPAAQRIYEKRRQRLGVDNLRPWDLDVDISGRAPLRPVDLADELESKSEVIFHQVDPQLGEYFSTMRREGMLDLENRKGKAPGAFCIGFDATRRPFIFANTVGIQDDVQTLLHESGHAFHFFESDRLPYYQLKHVPMEFSEVASMGMELLAAPYLTASSGGFYTEQDTARARIEHLEEIILFWPYMAIVDAFQHWVYANPQEAYDPSNCDAQWAALWDRFRGGVDWSGLEQEKMTGWQRKEHIHEAPFYYVEYGLAQLGAVQVWRNALQDQAEAVASYRKALSLGGSVPLPQLFSTAGARFAFDSAILKAAVRLLEDSITSLEAIAGVA